MDFDTFLNVIPLLQRSYDPKNSDTSKYVSYFEKHSISGRLPCEQFLSMLDEMFSFESKAFPKEIDTAFKGMKEGKLQMTCVIVAELEEDLLSIYKEALFEHQTIPEYSWSGNTSCLLFIVIFSWIMGIVTFKSAYFYAEAFDNYLI